MAAEGARRRCLAAAAILVLGAGPARDGPQRVDDAELLRVLGTSRVEEISRCRGSDEPGLRVRVYDVPDPRELATVRILEVCPIRTVFVAVSSCDETPRHALYRVPERCALRSTAGGFSGLRSEVDVEAGPSVRLELRWVPRTPDPERGGGIAEFVTLQVSLDSAQIVATERHALPDWRH